MPQALLDRWAIPQVSLYVGWGGDLRPENCYEDLDAFYARLSESTDLPVTSQPSVGDFLAVFEPLAAAGRDIVSIHIAGGLSGTCESGREAARIVAEQHSGRARRDRRRAERRRRARAAGRGRGAGGGGAARTSTPSSTRSGAPARASTSGSRSTRSSTCGAGGRIGAAQALVGSALKIKPILTFGTEITPVGRVRTSRRAFERMVAYLHELHDRGATDWIVQHAQSHDDAERLVAEGRAIFGSEPLFCTQVGPVLGAHLGSGMLVGGMGPG